MAAGDRGEAERSTTRDLIAVALVALLLPTGLAPDARASDPDRVPEVSDTTSPARSQAERPNVVLLSIDTLRRDHLPIYGYDKNTSPHLQEFSKRAVVFDSAITPHTNTAPAHASMMTGKYPGSHGILDNWAALRVDVDTLAEVLSREGYQTGAFLSGLTLSTHTQLQRGFDVYDAPTAPRRQRRADRTWAKAAHWLRQVAAKEEPIFLFLHFYDPHNPYNPPDGFGRRFGQRRKFEKGDVDHARKSYLENDSPQFVSEVISRYDGEIAYADHHAGKLFAQLKELGRMSNTLLIFTSDHGETLFERDWVFDHGCRLYDEQTRVPLVIRFPADQYAGKRIQAQVSHVDLMQTILERLSLETTEQLEGNSLIPLIASSGKNERRTEHPQPMFSIARLCKKRLGTHAAEVGGGKLISGARTPDYKLIEYPGLNDGKLIHLFDLHADPLELKNLAHEYPDVTQRLTTELEQWRAVTQLSKPTEVLQLAPELKESLRSLGYAE